jgi:hypothetical protein
VGDSTRDRFRKILNFGGKSEKPPLAPAAPASQPAAPPGASTPTPVARAAPLPNPIETPPQPADPAPRPSIASMPVEPATQTELPSQPEPAAASKPSTPADLRRFLQELRTKMAQLAEDFAQGKLNRLQFQEIYAHYQSQRQQVETALVNAGGLESLRASVAVGMTGLLRERHAAKVLSYALYDNESSLPLASVGSFRIDTSLLVPMLSSFRSAATEMFGAGLRSTEIEGGHWLCFVPGQFTTLMVLFSVEPARVQLTLIEDLHRDFEVANRAALIGGRGREAADLFTRIWALDKAQMS